MLAASVLVSPHQFSEVNPQNLSQRAALLKNQFEIENEWSNIASLLGPLLLPLVTRIWVAGDGLHYERLSFDSDEPREFLMLKRGQPPPVVQDVPYYEKGSV